MNMNFRQLPVIDRVLIATFVVLAVAFLAVSTVAYAGQDAGASPATSTKDAHRAAGNWNFAGELASPASLEFDGCEANQQFRVELMDPAAPADSTAAKDVLATMFKTSPGDPSRLVPRTITFDLSRWAGKRVRIRFAQVDNRGPLRAGVDDVRLAQIGS